MGDTLRNPRQNPGWLRHGYCSEYSRRNRGIMDSGKGAWVLVLGILVLSQSACLGRKNLKTRNLALKTATTTSPKKGAAPPTTPGRTTVPGTLPSTIPSAPPPTTP